MKLVSLLRYASWLLLGLGGGFPLWYLLKGADTQLLSSTFGILTCCLVASPYLLAAGLVLLARNRAVAGGALAINFMVAVASALAYYQVLSVNSGRESGLIFLFFPFCQIAGCVVLWLLFWLGYLVWKKSSVQLPEPTPDQPRLRTESGGSVQP